MIFKAVFVFSWKWASKNIANLGDTRKVSNEL
jgi:hypothetical protein